MPPAARLTDLHTCPMVDVLVPHVGGPVTGPGAPTVLIGSLPAACLGDLCVCVGPPDTIILGSATVLIGGKPAARMGDTTAHGGVITLGCPTVIIGGVAMPSEGVVLGDYAGGGRGGGVATSAKIEPDVAGVRSQVLPINSAAPLTEISIELVRHLAGRWQAGLVRADAEKLPGRRGANDEIHPVVPGRVQEQEG